uniref:Macro domain-containing protein n=1 Tax=Fervidobacterium pennivorans TaxID=93466 RepID=A0A7V4KBT2_FERPE
MIIISPFSVFEHIHEVDAIVNTINTKGYMGKGLALEFALRFPKMEEAYKKACQQGIIKPGSVWVYQVEVEYWEDVEAKRERKRKLLKVLNAATKDDFKLPSKMEWIESIVDEIKDMLIRDEIQAVALPKLGAGLGKLQWEAVEEVIVTRLYELDKKIIISLDLLAGEREKLAIELAMREFSGGLFEEPQKKIEMKIRRFREFLSLEGVGKKRYSELVNKYF